MGDPIAVARVHRVPSDTGAIVTVTGAVEEHTCRWRRVPSLIAGFTCARCHGTVEVGEWAFRPAHGCQAVSATMCEACTQVVEFA